MLRYNKKPLISILGKCEVQQLQRPPWILQQTATASSERTCKLPRLTPSFWVEYTLLASPKNGVDDQFLFIERETPTRL